MLTHRGRSGVLECGDLVSDRSKIAQETKSSKDLPAGKLVAARDGLLDAVAFDGIGHLSSLSFKPPTLECSLDPPVEDVGMRKAFMGTPVGAILTSPHGTVMVVHYCAFIYTSIGTHCRHTHATCVGVQFDSLMLDRSP